MTDVRWELFPVVAHTPSGKRWLTIQANLGLAPNTITAFGRALEDYLRCCARRDVAPEAATREHIAVYVRELAEGVSPAGDRQRRNEDGGLANATLQQRLTAVRRYYDDLVVDGIRPDNPVGRGRYTPNTGFGGTRARGLVPRFHKLPWIPTAEEWRAVLEAMRDEPVRNRLMLALTYDAALRREEVCGLETGDIDPALRLVSIRAERTKNRHGRVVPFSPGTGQLYVRYLEQRRTLSRERGPLFLSESRRNRARPLSIWTWSKVVERIADRAGVPRFTTHTPRHLCLTDLARSGWDLHEIAQGMATIHQWRVATMQEVWNGAIET